MYIVTPLRYYTTTPLHHCIIVAHLAQGPSDFLGHNASAHVQAVAATGENAVAAGSLGAWGNDNTQGGGG